MTTFRRGAAQRSAGWRTGGWWIGILLLSVIAGLMWWWSVASTFPTSRVTLLVVGDPMMVVSWNRDKKTVLLVTIPSATRIDATRGYGRYALDALWKLGELENRPSTVLLESTEDALGVPIPWYLRPPGTQLSADPIGILREMFSLQSVVSVLVGTTKTNISVPRFLALAGQARFVRANEVSTLDLSGAIGTEQLADGTQEPAFVPEPLEALIGSDFEEAPLRAEGLTVAIYNTTETPILGQRAARMLSHAGTIVVSVGNEEPVRETCMVQGKKQLLSSATARFIRWYFGCTEVASEGVARADLLLYLGKDVENRYLPPVH